MSGWYYKQGDLVHGPESRAQLDSLALSGYLGDDSLVSRLPDGPWQPYQSLVVPAAPGLSPADSSNETPEFPHCSRCGRAYGASELLSFRELLLCGRCKSDYFQHLAQGTLNARALPPHAFSRRAFAKAVDAMMLVLFYASVQSTLRLFVQDSGTDWPEMFSGGLTLGLFLACSTVAMARYGGTPGKRVFDLRVTELHGESLGYFQAFTRSVAELLSLASGGLGYLLTGPEGQRRPLHDLIARTQVEYGEGLWPWQL